MAGRIRTIKPELLENERTAGLEHDTWRLFVSLLLLADDYGNLTAHPDRLCGSIFWARKLSRDIRDCLAELSQASLTMPYEVRGQQFIAIVGWHEHQKVDKPGKPRVPGPDQALTEIPETLARPSRVPPETLGPDRRYTTTISDRVPRAHARIAPEQAWLDASGNRAGNPGDCLTLRRHVDQCAVDSERDPDELYADAVREFRAWRDTCSPDRMPSLSPLGVLKHWGTVWERLTGSAPRTPTPEAHRPMSKVKAS